MLKQYQEILDMVCNKFKLDLEHEMYSKIIYKNVNNYIAITQNNKIKRKGLFLLDFNEEGKRETPLGNSCDEYVINKSLNAYYTKDISPREFIANPDKYDLHIYDYCKSNKIGKDFTVYHNGQIQQQLNRYYFSKNGAYLFKQKFGQGTMQHVNVGQPVTLFNNYVNKSWEDYNVDYNYYISATQKIIDEIANFNQLKLF